MEDFLRGIGIYKLGTVSEDDSYIVDLRDSNEYSKYYSILDNSDLEFVDDISLTNLFSSNLVYQNDTYQINLQGDFENDIYKLVVSYR